MSKYFPSETQTHIKTVAYIRQNPWGVNSDKFDSVLKSNRLHAPWAHTKDQIDHIQIDGGELIGKNKGTRYINCFKSLTLTDVVLVPDGKRGLLVRINSPMKYDSFETLCIAHTARECGHFNNKGRIECPTCHSSVVEVFNPSNTEKVVMHLKKGHSIETFYSPYYEVEIVGEADYNGTSGNSIAGPDAAGKWTRYWKLA